MAMTVALTDAWNANRLMNDSPLSWSDNVAADARRMRSWHVAVDADDAMTMTTAADYYDDDDDDDWYHDHGYDGYDDDADHRPWC